MARWKAGWSCYSQKGKKMRRRRRIQWGGFVGVFTELNRTVLLCPLTATLHTSCLGQRLKGEAGSVVNMWLHAEIPRPASPPPHHLSVRIIEQHIMCSQCAVLSCSSLCYHQQGQRFHYNVRWTRKLWIDSGGAAATLRHHEGQIYPDLNSHSCLFNYRKEEDLCKISAKMWCQVRKILLFSYRWRLKFAKRRSSPKNISGASPSIKVHLTFHEHGRGGVCDIFGVNGSFKG